MSVHDLLSSSNSLLGASVLVALAIAVLLPLLISRTFFATKDARPKKQVKKDPAVLGSIQDEPWCPKMEERDWKEAVELMDCPWDFSGCSEVEDAIRQIWLAASSEELQMARDELLRRTRRVRIVRVTIPWQDVVRFAVVYHLQSGAELFGGECFEVATASCDVGAANAAGKRRHDLVEDLDEVQVGVMKALHGFYRVHDGFGVLLNPKHLPVLLASPGDHVHGSCFYVYPVRGLERTKATRFLPKFARVDATCIACLDLERQPSTTFIEKSGLVTQDEESPLSFAADTVRILSGERVAPAEYMYRACDSKG